MLSVHNKIYFTYLPVSITDKDHLLHQLAIRRGLRHNLPEDQQQLLDHMVLQRQHEPDDDHQETGDLLPREDDPDCLL